MDDLISLAIIWIAIFFAHMLAKETKFTAVLWFLAMGCLLVNVGLLPVEPTPFIQNFADLGIIIIMFALGFEENSNNFVLSLKRSWGIAIVGAIVPFAMAYGVSFYFWHNSNASLMCGLAMTATAVSLTLVSLRSEHLHRTKAATGIMTSAILDDIASLALVAILVPVAAGETQISIFSVSMILIKALLFFLLITFMALWLFPVASGPLNNIPFIRRFNLRLFITMDHGEHATLTVLLLALLVALLGHEFGFHPAVGAYMAGLILKEEYFLLTEENGRVESRILKETQLNINSVAFSWIGPIFFIVLGSNLLLDVDMLSSIIDEVLVLTVAIFIAQVLSAGLAARFTGGFNWAESVLIGFGMLGRAELAFLVMNIAYIQHTIISMEMFYTLMLTAFWLNISVPLLIRWWRPYLEKVGQS